MKVAPKSLAAFALVLALSACGGSSEEQAAGPVASATAAATEAAAPTDAATPVETASPSPTDTASASPSPTPSPSATPTTAAAAATEPAAFAVCKACHSMEPGKHGIGPSLAGIWGEKAGDVDGYEFSDAMEESDLRWNQATLDRYLADPRGTVPGTKMAFAGVKDAAKRQEIIDWIRAH